MCNHIGFSGERQLGTLIYLDTDLELKQSDFNNLVRFLWIGSESKNSEIKTYSENMLDRLYQKFDDLSRKHDIFKVETVSEPK